MSLHEKGRKQEDTKSFITPSLHLCFFQGHNLTPYRTASCPQTIIPRNPPLVAAVYGILAVARAVGSALRHAPTGATGGEEQLAMEWHRPSIPARASITLTLSAEKERKQKNRLLVFSASRRSHARRPNCSTRCVRMPPPRHPGAVNWV